ncbi:hypothetical protein NHF46_18825 [Arthrobacter alpinus]|nr:hypothetical protein [Arthrobacter alpinus]
MSVKLTPPTLARLRLAAQGILPTSTSPAQGPVDVVRSLTALQGQDFPGALWSIGLRSPGSTRADIEAPYMSPRPRIWAGFRHSPVSG